MMLTFRATVSQPVFKGISTNVLGLLAAQAITFGSTTIVTRLYAPSEFGLYANLVSWILIATPLCNFGLPSALCYARTDRDAHILWNVAVLASLMGGLVIAITGAILAIEINRNPFLPMVVGCGVFFTTLNHVQTQWAFRANDLGARLKCQVTGSAVVAAGKMIAGIGFPSAFSLAIAQWSNGIVASIVIRKEIKLRPFQSGSRGGGRIYALTLARYSEFLRYAGPWRLTKYLFSASPVLIVSSFAGLESAGQFALAFTVVSGPLILLSDAITDAVRRPIVDAFDRSEAEGRRLVTKITTRMPVVSMMPAAVLFLGGETLFDFAFGPGWQTAASLSRWLVLWLGLQFVVQPIIAAFPVRGLQKNLLLQEVFFGVARLSAFAACLIGYHHLKLAVAAYSLVGIAMSVSLAFTYFRSFHTHKSHFYLSSGNE